MEEGKGPKEGGGRKSNKEIIQASRTPIIFIKEKNCRERDLDAWHSLIVSSTVSFKFMQNPVDGVSS